MGKLNVAIADDNEVMRDLLEEMVTSDEIGRASCRERVSTFV